MVTSVLVKLNERSSRRGKEQMRSSAFESGRVEVIKDKDLRVDDNPCNGAREKA